MPEQLEQKPLIELKNVSKSFYSNVILDQVNLSIFRGQAVGMIEPSGTGKSTILRIIAGLLRPDAGEVGSPVHFMISKTYKKKQANNFYCIRSKFLKP
jgi:ABC-type transporter Mla maintaining outer membrane lipid asymmetry ATPase subunit MlaF